ncbi:phage tail protein I [Salmonella enterica]|nr:phage tail protein I [Salmonella enterica]
MGMVAKPQVNSAEKDVTDVDDGAEKVTAGTFWPEILLRDLRLASRISVDRWDKSWPEQTKRQVIKASWMVHRHKGTISALRNVVEPFGFLLRVIEWWQNGEQPGTFRLEIGIQEHGITEETYHELERLIDDARPVSRHLTGLSLSLQTQGDIGINAGCYVGDTLTVYPCFPETISVGGGDYTGAAVHLIDTVEIANVD